MVTRAVVPSSAADGLGAPEALTHFVDKTPHATSQRLKVGDRKHHTAAGLCNARHLADSFVGSIEMIDRPLADHGVETRIGERQRVAPGADPARHPAIGPGAIRSEHFRHTGHPCRRLGSDHIRAPLTQCDRILAYPTRNVENPPALPGLGEVQSHARHAFEQELTIERRSGGDDIAHVPIEVDHAHGGGH